MKQNKRRNAETCPQDLKLRLVISIRVLRVLTVNEESEAVKQIQIFLLFFTTFAGHFALRQEYFIVTKINPLKTKRRLLYLKTQSVPRCKHFSSRL